MSFLHRSPDHIVRFLNCGRLNKANLSSVKCYVFGGSRAPLHLAKCLNRYLRDGKNAHNSYGFNETAGVISVDYPVCGINNVSWEKEFG